LRTTQHPTLVLMIEAPPLAPGTTGPAFTLQASDGSTVVLAEVLAKGGAVLIFYPGNNTPGCDRQLRAVKDEISRYEAAGVVPYGINPASVAEHREYAASLGLPFLLLSDPGLRAAKAWHATTPLDDQVFRTVYLVDRDGTVLFSAHGMPDATITLEALEEA
jgi:peroxiredoxin Q/BCP